MLPTVRQMRQAEVFTREWEKRQANGTLTGGWLAEQGDSVDALVTLYREIQRVVHPSQEQ